MLDITHNYLDYFSGQHNCSIEARMDGELVGTLQYSLFEGEVSVQMIDVRLKRQGVGTALVLDLQRRFPGTEIDFGIVTPEGDMLLKGLEWRVEPNLKRQSMLDELALVEATLKDYHSRADLVAGMSETAKQSFLNEVSNWNELSDRADQLQNELWKAPVEFRYVVGKKSVKVAANSSCEEELEQDNLLAMAC